MFPWTKPIITRSNGGVALSPTLAFSYNWFDTGGNCAKQMRLSKVRTLVGRKNDRNTWRGGKIGSFNKSDWRTGEDEKSTINDRKTKQCFIQRVGQLDGAPPEIGCNPPSKELVAIMPPTVLLAVRKYSAPPIEFQITLSKENTCIKHWDKSKFFSSLTLDSDYSREFRSSSVLKDEG